MFSQQLIARSLSPVAASWPHPAAAVRGYAVRRRRRDTLHTQHSASSDPTLFAFVVLKPEDKNDAESSFLNMLNPFKAVRSGPALYAVAAMQRSLCTMEAVGQRTAESSAGQDKLSEGFLTNMPKVTRSTAGTVLGSNNDAKLVPDAVVAVNFNTDPDPTMALAGAVSQYDFADKALTWNANFNQGYGRVVNVHRNSKGQAESTDVAFEGLWSDQYSTSVSLHYPTEGGFYACVHPSRIIAHANFRNILINTLVHDLSWELALVWPEHVKLEQDLQFFDAETGERIVRAGKTIRDLVTGKMKVKVHGHEVPVLDPTQALPQGLWA